MVVKFENPLSVKIGDFLWVKYLLQTVLTDKPINLL